MKSIAISLAAIFLLAVSVGPTAAAQDAAKDAAPDNAKIAGKWALTTQEPQGTQTRILTITQNGGKFTGTLKSQLVASPVEGTVDGNKVTFTAKTHTPHGDTPLLYTGTTQGDTMKGTVKIGTDDVAWTASQMHE